MKRIRKLTAFLLVLILGCSVVAPAYTAQAATVKLNATKKSLYGVGTTCQLKLQNATEVSWSTSNKKIATVSSTGKVTAKGVGSCTITAKNKKTGKKYRCSVKVYEVKLNTTGIQFESIGETYQLTLKNATKVRWSSSDENVATVSTKGKVSATGEGSCTIYAENINTGKKYSCKVSVESLKSTIVSINLVKSQTQKLLYVCCDTKLKGIPYLLMIDNKEISPMKEMINGDGYLLRIIDVSNLDYGVHTLTLKVEGMKDVFGEFVINQFIKETPFVNGDNNLIVKLDPSLNGKNYTIWIDGEKKNYDINENGEGYEVYNKDIEIAFLIDASWITNGTHVLKIEVEGYPAETVEFNKK